MELDLPMTCLTWVPIPHDVFWNFPSTSVAGTWELDTDIVDIGV